MDDREEKVNAVYEDIEKNLILLGATAIEDKLQDGVPDAIANLALADIKLWVLTGDKQETAINIGYSCRLLSDEMVDIFIVDAADFAEVANQLRRYREAIANVLAHSQGTTACTVIRFENDFNAAETPVDPSGGFALVVNGHSLVFALDPSMELLFLEVACQCKAVICCRVTPLQKALVVDLIKRHKGAVTLAIGDGANDVSMIKKISKKGRIFWTHRFVSKFVGKVWGPGPAIPCLPLYNSLPKHKTSEAGKRHYTFATICVVYVSYSTCSSPQLDQVQESARPHYRRTIHGKGGECSLVVAAGLLALDLGRPGEEV
ncbi:Phospholipid-transporting ATPase ID [Araneus ventricosus]|uniref:P-type phospholipid transporter n=1 Tax=Araneus ventricosus TaxID=182803 RepID=A0A4Y2VAL4_ARAVE|nr:Phospholipid-transporting ATPase ID [Araneus ventricosus]